MGALMQAVADIVAGIAGVMGMNNTVAAGIDGDIETWYFVMGAFMEPVMTNLSSLMGGLGDILGTIADLFA